MSAQVPPPLDAPAAPGESAEGKPSFFDIPHHKRLRGFESFDRIEFRVVPRYKTSGLSGDEWRQHVQVDFYFKGEKVHESGFRDMQSALMMVGSEWVRAQEPIPERVIQVEQTKCDQPSCEADAVVSYLLKAETSDRGDYLDPAHGYGRKYRQFCKRHAKRGDCSREDADDNYEPMGAVGPEDSTNLEESPSATFVVAPDVGAAEESGTMTTLVKDLLSKPETAVRNTIVGMARAGDFHDFKSFHALPKHALVAVLKDAGYEDLARNTMMGLYDETPSANTAD